MIQTLEIASLTFDMIGKVLIAITALLVHHNLVKERRIDIKIIKEVRLEEILGLLGIVLILIGYLLHIEFWIQ